MRYGICQWNLPVEGPEGCYEVKKLGLDGMELNYSLELIENINAYKKASEETGVEFPTIGMNIFCGESYIKEGTETFFETEIEKALKCAEKLNTKTVQIPAFFASDIKTDEELRIAAKNLQKACKMAEKYKINIGIENALDAQQNQKLFEIVKHPQFKFYFDNQNLWRMKGKKCAPVLQIMKDLIVEVHVKDSLIQDGKQKWMPLGTGDAEFETSMSFLTKTHYEGWIHLENDYQIDSDKYDFEEAIRKDLETVKRWQKGEK